MGFFDLGLGDVLDFVGQERANAANKKEARRNRRWQERMSSTAHQREVADLRAAGLNPILSATGGHGASTPGGAQANIANSAKDFGRKSRENQIMREQLKNVTADTGLKNEQAAQANQAAMNLIANFDLLSQQRINAANSGRSISAQADIDEMDAKLYKENPLIRNIKLMGPLMGGAATMLQNKGFLKDIGKEINLNGGNAAQKGH